MLSDDRKAIVDQLKDNAFINEMNKDTPILKIVISVVMVITMIALALWLLGIYGVLFRSHLAIFMFLVAFIPALSFWIGSNDFLQTTPPANIRILQYVMLWIAIALSFGAFANYSLIRDFIGHKYVYGFEVRYFEDADELGRPIEASDFHTATWLGHFALWLFEWVFLLACVASPVLTWAGFKRLIRKREDDEYRQKYG